MDERTRCWWCGTDPLYSAYHDEEWGYPVKDDVRLFEKLSLEGFQSGLSWLTILRKRERFREVFHGFDFERIARYTKRDVERLVVDPGIVRHRGKIESTIQNARRALELVDEVGSLAAYVWSFEPPARSRPRRVTRAVVQGTTTTHESRELARDLKRRGWSFVGPTIAHAFLQAMGLVNDHVEGCWCRPTAEKARERFRRPASAGRP